MPDCQAGRNTSYSLTGESVKEGCSLSLRTRHTHDAVGACRTVTRTKHAGGVRTHDYSLSAMARDLVKSAHTHNSAPTHSTPQNSKNLAHALKPELLWQERKQERARGSASFHALKADLAVTKLARW